MFRKSKSALDDFKEKEEKLNQIKNEIAARIQLLDRKINDLEKKLGQRSNYKSFNRLLDRSSALKALIDAISPKDFKEKADSWRSYLEYSSTSSKKTESDLLDKLQRHLNEYDIAIKKLPDHVKEEKKIKQRRLEKIKNELDDWIKQLNTKVSKLAKKKPSKQTDENIKRLGERASALTELSHAESFEDYETKKRELERGTSFSTWNLNILKQSIEEAFKEYIDEERKLGITNNAFFGLNPPIEITKEVEDFYNKVKKEHDRGTHFRYATASSREKEFDLLEKFGKCLREYDAVIEKEKLAKPSP